MKQSAWRYLWTAKDIRKKLLFTLLILVIYRFAANVPVPGVDRATISAFFEGGSAGANLVGFMDMISGGTIRNFSVLAMGVYPYITAQIILQLLVPIIPALQKRMEEDQREGRKWMEKWTYILAIPMAALSAFGQIQMISYWAGTSIIPGFGFGAGSDVLKSVTIIIAMTAGTMFGIWLGELISEKGLKGQGLSMIIFSGIVANIPKNFAQVIVNPNGRLVLTTYLIILTVAIIFVVVVIQQGRRNINVFYPGRRVGRRQSMPVTSKLPLMVNMAGMIPIIFAQSILQFPSIVAGFFVGSSHEGVAKFALSVQNLFVSSNGWYWLFYFFMVVFFAFFYTDVLFQQQNYGENLKKSGAKVQGVSPGKPTQDYLNKVLRRITLPGALFLGVVAVMPYISQLIVTAMKLGDVNASALLVSSSGMLIVVGTIRDMFLNIDTELKLRGYDDKMLVR